MIMFRERFNSILKKFLIWRLHKVPDRTFIMFIAVLTGIAAGLAAVLLKNSVHYIRMGVTTWFSPDNENYLFIISPALGIFLVIIFLRQILKKKLEPGVAMVLRSKSQKNGRIEGHNMFSHLISSALTIGFGGSVGLEGPTVATGSAIGSNIGRLFHLNSKQIVLLIGCACTAAIAAIFKAPIAGLVFALEVIMLDLTMSSLIPLLLASVAATLTSYLFLGHDVIYFVERIDSFWMRHIPYYILLGILTGFLSLYFTKVYMFLHNGFAKIKSWITRFFIGSFALGLLIFLFPGLYGEGYEVINASLHGDYSYLFNNSLFYAFSDSIWIVIMVFVAIILLKVFAAGVTFGAGGVGGIFAPSLFIGANVGLFLSYVLKLLGFNVSSTNFALVGMAGTIAGVIHAPLTAIFLIAELTGGYGLFVPLMIVATLSYLTVRLFNQKSLFLQQLSKTGEIITHHKDKTVLSMMKVDQLIESNFICVKSDNTLRELIFAIERSTRNIYPVVDDEGKLEGIVFLDHIRHIIFKQELYDTTYVSNFMFMPQPLVNIKDTVEAVAEKFQDSGNYNLPVVDDNNKYVGFISRAKVFSNYRRLTKQISDE
ncbi:MAG TPA: chloride channel protein [Bacteroidales bacterium]|nr:chloride channel protein [Bacteroidales bacterium]